MLIVRKVLASSMVYPNQRYRILIKRRSRVKRLYLRVSYYSAVLVMLQQDLDHHGLWMGVSFASGTFSSWSLNFTAS